MLFLLSLTLAQERNRKSQGPSMYCWMMIPWLDKHWSKKMHRIDKTLDIYRILLPRYIMTNFIVLHCTMFVGSYILCSCLIYYAIAIKSIMEIFIEEIYKHVS